MEIWAVPAAGGAPRRLARIPQALGGSCGGLGIAWSPDGTRVATGGSDGIYVIALGRRPSATLAIKAPCAEYPVFSPDGSQIAFDARPSLGPGSETAIMLANADGSGLHTLTAVPFRQSVHPTWLP